MHPSKQGIIVDLTEGAWPVLAERSKQASTAFRPRLFDQHIEHGEREFSPEHSNQITEIGSHDTPAFCALAKLRADFTSEFFVSVFR